MKTFIQLDKQIIKARQTYIQLDIQIINKIDKHIDIQIINKTYSYFTRQQLNTHSETPQCTLNI